MYKIKSDVKYFIIVILALSSVILFMMFGRNLERLNFVHDLESGVITIDDTKHVVIYDNDKPTDTITIYEIIRK